MGFLSRHLYYNIYTNFCKDRKFTIFFGIFSHLILIEVKFRYVIIYIYSKRAFKKCFFIKVIIGEGEETVFRINNF